MEEVSLLKVAGKHPNVVSLQAFFEDQEAFYIVMEMCEGGELYHRLADKVKGGMLTQGKVKVVLLLFLWCRGGDTGNRYPRCGKGGYVCSDVFTGGVELRACRMVCACTSSSDSSKRRVLRRGGG